MTGKEWCSAEVDAEGMELGTAELVAHPRWVDTLVVGLVRIE